MMSAFFERAVTLRPRAFAMAINWSLSLVSRTDCSSACAATITFSPPRRRDDVHTGQGPPLSTANEVKRLPGPGSRPSTGRTRPGKTPRGAVSSGDLPTPANYQRRSRSAITGRRVRPIARTMSRPQDQQEGQRCAPGAHGDRPTQVGVPVGFRSPARRHRGISPDGPSPN